MQAPKPIISAMLQLRKTTRSVPSHVYLTGWGKPLAEARHVVFFFGGMPASAEEPALHSLAVGNDIYARKDTHLLCLDKPGMGRTPLSYWFRIQRDWPEMVDQVCEHYGIEKYHVMGVSNGGPYVMACLTHPKTAPKVLGAAMIVGVSNVRASKYFSLTHPSGLFEGLYNSLPVVVAGPLTFLMMSAGPIALFRFGGYEKLFSDLPNLLHPEAKAMTRNLIAHSVRNWGIGAQIDCQQGLSPLYADNPRDCTEAYKQIQTPVQLWYGSKDGSVPIQTAQWLEDTIPNSELHIRPVGHGLYFYHASEVLDSLVG